jgi:hypothetical protein
MASANSVTDFSPPPTYVCVSTAQVIRERKIGKIEGGGRCMPGSFAGSMRDELITLRTSLSKSQDILAL